MGFSHAPLSVTVSDVLQLFSELGTRVQSLFPSLKQRSQHPSGLGGVELDSLHPQDAENLIVLSNWESATMTSKNP